MNLGWSIDLFEFQIFYFKNVRVFFQESEEWNKQLEIENLQLGQLEAKIYEKKTEYKKAMQNLSVISEEIHNKRNLVS